MRSIRCPLIPPLAAAVLLALPGGAGAATLARQVSSSLAAGGGASGAYVYDTTTGRPLVSIRADSGRIPASNEKLFVTAAALLRYGPDATLQTTVSGSGQLDDAGVLHGDLYLRGGGDPTFGTDTFTRSAYGTGATLSALASAVAAAGVARVTGTVYGDESWFDTRRGGPASGYGLDVDLGGLIGALDVNRGLAREDGSALQTQPATFAAKQLVAALKKAGVTTGGKAGARRTPSSAQRLASVDSPTIATLVKLTLVPSDNLFAEILLKDLGARFGAGGTTAAGAAVVRSTVRRYGISPTIVDGSGLSRADRTTPRQVVTLLSKLRDQQGLRTGMAVAGRTGTLAARMRRTAAQGRCQGKTGTLSNVSALSGYCTTANGHVVAFSILQNAVVPSRARLAQDRIAVALARSWPAGSPLPTATATKPAATTVPGGAAAPAG